MSQDQRHKGSLWETTHVTCPVREAAYTWISKGFFFLFKAHPHSVFLSALGGSLYIVCCIHISISSPTSSPFFSLSLSPVIFYFYIYLTQKRTHLSLSLSFPPVIVMVCQSVRVPHSGGFSEWVTGPALLFSDTCQSLICHLCAEMEMSGSDTTCQRWRWRLTSLRQPLNQLHISQLVCRLANNNYLLPAFRGTLFVVQWCHTTQAAELGCCGCGVGIMHGECPSAIWELMQTHSVCIQACICWKQFHFSSFTRLSTSAIKCTITHFNTLRGFALTASVAPSSMLLTKNTTAKYWLVAGCRIRCIFLSNSHIVLPECVEFTLTGDTNSTLIQLQL